MKIALFTKAENYIEYLKGMVADYERAVARHKQELAEIENERAAFLKVNNISPENAEQAWADHIKWKQGYIKSVTRKLNKYKKELREAIACNQ